MTPSNPAARSVTTRTGAYISDSEKQDAVERRLGIIGEALHRAERLEPTLIDRLPELREIVGMRNRIIHGYDVMDIDIVWDVMQNRLPALEIHLADLLGESEPQ